MGALHEGHATLLKQVRSRCDISVLSIFVNPTQFGPKEDLSKYPRTFEADLAIAAREGVDVIFAPTPEEMYPSGYSTYVEEEIASQPLCGKFRPGHFRGVTTIVLKLFHLIQPNLALFGLKDAQQFFVLNKMVRDLNLDVQVIGVPTIRESDGLALSSRNVYLTHEERQLAPLLYQTLISAKNRLLKSSGAEDIGSVLTSSIEALENQNFQVQYLQCLSLPDLKPTHAGVLPGAPHLIAVAAYLGKTRLIDNIILSPEGLARFEIKTLPHS
jgi:pantoate--beta-alanine ligase